MVLHKSDSWVQAFHVSSRKQYKGTILKTVKAFAAFTMTFGAFVLGSDKSVTPYVLTVPHETDYVHFSRASTY